MKDQLLQKRRNVYHTAASGKALHQARSQIERAHGDCAGHRKTVPDAAGNPDGALSGNHPGTLASADGHDSAAGVDQLIFVMEMFGDDVVVNEVEREGRDLGG